MRILLSSVVLSMALAAQPAPELVISVGHPGGPDRVAFAGSFLATAASTNVALIDLSTGLTVAHLPQGGLVLAMEASPAGDLLAVGTCGHAIQLWNVKTRTLARRIALEQECAESLSFSPDGTLLATGAESCCKNNGLQIFDLRSGALLRTLTSPSGIIAAVFGGDGRWVAGVDSKGIATVFEWPSGRKLRTYDGLGRSGSSDAALASRDGRYFAWMANGLRVWDVRSGTEIQLPGRQRQNLSEGDRHWTEDVVPASAAEFLDDGRLAYVDGSHQLVFMRLPGGVQRALPLVWSEDWTGNRWMRIRRDGWLMAGSDTWRTVTWDVAAARRRELTAPPLAWTGPLQWSRLGLVAWAGLSGVRGWDDRLGKPVASGRDDDIATDLAFRADGTRLAVSASSSVYLFDLAGRRTHAARGIRMSDETAVAFSRDGSRLAFAPSSTELVLFDDTLRRLRRIATLDAYTRVERAAFSADGRWVAAGLGAPHPSLRVWPVESEGGVTLDTTDTTYGSQPPAFSADSRRLASFIRGESVTVWATSSWSAQQTWKLSGSGQALAFAPEGARLAVATDTGAAIWDADTGRRLIAFSTPGSARFQAIAWSPDGRRVATSADDGVLRFWSASDGRLLASVYMLNTGDDWLLTAPDGRFDGSEGAVARVVAWRTGERVVTDPAMTERRRVRGLWRSLPVQ